MQQGHASLMVQQEYRRCHVVIIPLQVLHGRPASSVMRPQGMPPPSSRSSTGQPSVSFCLDACLTDLASGTLECWPNGPLSCGLRHGGIRGSPVTMCGCFRPEASDAIPECCKRWVQTHVSGSRCTSACATVATAALENQKVVNTLAGRLTPH
jgi:hypothetical protein